MNKTKTILLVLAIFFSGSAFGIFGTAAYLRHHLGPMMDGPPLDPQPHALRVLSTRLGLSPAQEAEARAILAEFIASIEAVRQEFKAKADPLLLGAAARLKAHLDPGQQAALDRLVDEIIKHGPPHPPPPGGFGHRPGGPGREGGPPPPPPGN